MCATPFLLDMLHPLFPPLSSPGGCGDGISKSTMGGCGSRYSRVYRLYHSGFLNPIQGQWHWAEHVSSKLSMSRVQLNQVQKLGKYL